MSTSTIESPLASMLDRARAAEFIGVKMSTLEAWAHTGRHRDLLPVARIGKRSYYRIADLQRFIESRFSPSAR